LRDEWGVGDFVGPCNSRETDMGRVIEKLVIYNNKTIYFRNKYGGGVGKLVKILHFIFIA